MNVHGILPGKTRTFFFRPFLIFSYPDTKTAGDLWEIFPPFESWKIGEIKTDSEIHSGDNSTELVRHGKKTENLLNKWMSLFFGGRGWDFFRITFF